MATYSNSANQIATLKELYKNPDEFMKDLVYKKNPLLALIPKDESEDGLGGKYMPVPLTYGVPQGRSHGFTNAQNNQTAPIEASFFVAVISDYQIATITNQLMKQTATNASAFIAAAKQSVDTGFQNISNNMAFELFSNGLANRGISTASSTQNGVVANGTVLPLSQIQSIVQFEIGMTLVASASDGGAPSSDTVVVTSVNRATGVVRGTASASSLSANWAIGSGAAYLSVQGDLPSAGASGTSTMLGLCGLGAWLPKVAPSPSENFWSVDRSVDATRLAGLRYDASSYTIEEGITNALAFASREGAMPDLCIMDFASYAALVNSLGAKVVYTQAIHSEAQIAFKGIEFQSPYGPVTILSDRSCPPQTAYVLTMDTWKLRSLGKAPAILTYGMEGLDGLRVSNADALEIRIGYYGNLTCSAPGWNMVVSLSS